MGYEFDKRNTNRKASAGPAARKDPVPQVLPNSLVMRVMEDTEAEKEANRLSQGITSQTPDGLLDEMGSRLGADFSSVQFHSDSISLNRGKALGARAWAQGRDVYFGKGGFDPEIAAHELVHTVQQGAVRGETAQSAPYGAVQLFRGEDENQIHRRAASANATTLDLMREQKNSSEYGPRVFSSLVKPAKKLAEKSGSRIRAMNDNNGMAFLANLSERDYSGKEIIRDIATRTVINKDEMYDRTDEYEGFMDYMQNRTDKVGLEAASLQAGILNGNPKYNHNNDPNINKRAYEMTAQELSADTFNPMHDTEITKVLNKIDAAHSEQEAYYAFLEYTENKEFTRQEINNGSMIVNFTQQPIPMFMDAKGKIEEVDPAKVEPQQQINDAIEAKITAAKAKIRNAKAKGKSAASGSQEREDAKQDFENAKKELKDAEDEKAQNARTISYRYKRGATVNIPLLKAKLKNMVRQVRDYPELKHKIGALNIQWNQTQGAFREGTSENVMAASTTAGAWEKAMISYDAYKDRNSPEGQQERDNINNHLANSIGNLNKVGNHELGHVLESTLNTQDEDHEKGKASNDILQSVLPKVMTPAEQAQVNYNQQDGLNAYNKHIYQGQIDTTSPIFAQKRMSSAYGQSMPKEWFAEAFHDVYTKGADAKPTSIEIVKEYEKRQIAKQKSGFRKKEAGFFTKVKRFFSRLYNFGRHHDDPDQAGAQPQQPAPQINNPNQGPAQPGIVDPNAGVQPVNEANAGLDPLLQEENELDKPMIVEAPKRKNLNKKKKKKK